MPGMSAQIKRRIFIPPERWSGSALLLPAESHYLVDVLRLGEGCLVEAFDGRGTACEARLCQDGRRWRLSMGERCVTRANHCSVRIGVALTKGRKLDIAVRMLTEIGVETIEPFSCTRSVTHPSGAGLAARIERWQNIARQAARQSGRCSVPGILPIRPLEAVLEARNEPQRVILHTGQDLPELPRLLANKPAGERILLIGPEGGFTEEEIHQALKAGFCVASLGLPVLRTETACVAAAAYAVLTHGARSDIDEAQRKNP
ncbi:MAG TPA: RsmE family RNA methyltransferase [Myxococcota bacterium]|nr:RsmE family RNA methyltransferase [Myxococcota bacterium]